MATPPNIFFISKLQIFVVKYIITGVTQMIVTYTNIIPRCQMSNWAKSFSSILSVYSKFRKL